MSAENWGGSAAAGGLTFQAAVSALCMVHMACGRPLRWSTCTDDTPVSVASETGGAGDDVALQLVCGETMEIQAKVRLATGVELWGALMALCRRASEDPRFHGVLAIGPSSSATVREQLARDVARLGGGRRDDLSNLGQTLATKLDAAKIPVTACARVRVQVVYLLDQANATTQAALAHLGRITTQPDAAWANLTAEAMRMIRLRGRRDTGTIAGVIPDLLDAAGTGIAPVVLAKQLLRWTLETTRTFEIPGFDKAFSLDDDWIELKARSKDKTSSSLASLEEALSHYHGDQAATSNDKDREISAETLGYFVRHCVAVAGPGMGKTLLLRRIARLLARKSQPALIIRLRPLAERMRGGDTFVDAALRIGLDGSSLRPQDVLTIGLENLTILLDGLDEAGSEQDQIAHAAAALSVSSPRCRIVVVTRPIGYETTRLSQWRHYELMPVEPSDGKRGVERLVDSGDGGTTDPKVKEATKAATHHLDYNSDARLSAKSPLLLALLASLALNGIVAARTRVGLYEQLFTLVERLAARKQSSASLTPAVLNAFLQQLGWELTEHAYANVNAVMMACTESLAPLLGEPPLKARSTCEEALRFWEMGGIVERVRFKVTEALTFVHKTFGEYAAARCILQQLPDVRSQSLRRVESAQRWNEVGVFLSALGMGRELVRIALTAEEDAAQGPRRGLQWARHSNDAMDEQTSQVLVQRSWAVIAGQHSQLALGTGSALLGAVGNLPTAGDVAAEHIGHDQWWTALVAWACMANCVPAQLDFGRLNAFMDWYTDRVDASSFKRRLLLNSPSRQLWEALLLAATKEAVRRGIGPDEQKVVDRVKLSLGARSMGFFGEFSYILKEAGLEVALPDYGSPSRFFSPDFLEERRRDTLVLLEAVCPESADAPVLVQPPYLNLSAFLYGSGLMCLEVSAAILAAGREGAADAKALIGLAARLSAYDYGQLLVEARSKLSVLRSADPPGRSWEGLEAVDAPMRFHGVAPEGVADLVVAGLLHRSKWIVHLAAELGEHYLTAEQAAAVVPKVFAKAPDLGLAGAAYLAIHFLGKDAARELIVQRLKEPLNQGCMQLFHYLRKAWDPSLDARLGDLLRAPLFFEPWTAEACLELVQACAIEHRKALGPLLKEAYDHWLHNEEPYPKADGAIPPSPRGEILKVLIKLESVTPAELFSAASDERHEVARAGKEALVKLMAQSEDARKEMLARIGSGAPLEDLLRDALRDRVPFGTSELEVVVAMLSSPRAEVRHAAMGVLEPSYMDSAMSMALVENLVSDDAQPIRDRAHEKLADLKRSA